MNTDFRVAVGMPSHPKTIKLMRVLGRESFYCLIQLWAWVAQNRPDGELVNMAVDDIEIAADWRGDDGRFVDTLVILRFMDQHDDGVYVIHDWSDNNRYAASAPIRSAQARKAAEARWGEKYKNKNAQPKNEQCSSMLPALPEHADSNAPDPIPVPDPTPDPEHEPDHDQTKTPTRVKNCPYQQITDAYQEKLPKLPVPAITKKLKTKMQARWREDRARQSIDWWQAYFARVAASDFLRGDNERGWCADLDWLCGPENMTKVLNGRYKTRKRAPPVPTTYAQCQDLERRQQTQWLIDKISKDREDANAEPPEVETRDG